MMALRVMTLICCLFAAGAVDGDHMTAAVILALSAFVGLMTEVAVSGSDPSGTDLPPEFRHGTE